MTKTTKRGGHVLEDDYPTHYLPGVGRQVMADGGVPSIDQIRQMLVGTAPPPSGPRPGAYTDPYGLKVSAPFVESMRGGYPTPPSMATSAPAQPSRSSLSDLISSIFGRRRSGYKDGGKPFDVLPLTETDKGIRFDPEAGVIGPVTKGLKYFYDTMSGQKEMDPTSEEAIRSATDIAGAVTLGAGAGEAPIEALRAGASKPIKAYHGSRDLFEKFDPSKAYTGEGVQPWTEGHYFGSPEPTALHYRTLLGGSSSKDWLESPGHVAIRHLETVQKPYYSGKDLVRMPAVSGNEIPKAAYEHALSEARRVANWDPSRSQQLIEAAELIRNPPGHAYEVELNVDPTKLLDLNKRVKNISPVFIEAMQDAGLGIRDLNDYTVAAALNRLEAAAVKKAKKSKEDTLLAERNVWREATEASKKAGFLGANYKMPRDWGLLKKRDPHYVIYDPENIKILRRYADGGEVEGDVQFLEDQQPASLPTFAQPQTQQITQALDAAREVNQPKKEYGEFGFLPLRTQDEKVVYDPGAGSMAEFVKGAFTPKISPVEIAKGAYEIGKGTLEGLSNAGRYFYDTISGQKPMDPTSEEAIQAATDIAGSLTMGSGAFERPAGALAAGASRPGMGHNMPPEPIVPTRVTNPIGMHSEAAEVARSLPQQKGTIEQMLAMMKQKVNPEELHWSGVAEAFQPGQKVTAEELAQHFESKLPKVRETVYGGAEHAFKYGSQDWSPQQWQNAIRRAEINRDFDRAEALMSEWETSSGLGSGVKAPMYPGYVTPGGANYREIVLHHPEHKDGAFTESHYDEPNVLGHLRMSDMTGPGGEKILNVHEFQSDWGQQARKKGVVTPDLEGKLDSVKNELDRAGNEYYKKQDELNQLINSGQITYKDSFEHPMFEEVENARQKYVKLEEQRQALAQQSRGVPHSPYVTSREGQHNTPGWTDLLIKRVLQEAERGGYDKVVWDTPAEQAKRYMDQPQIVKGMQGYYGDVLPRRHKKVVPEIKIGEHEVGRPASPIKSEEVADWLTYMADAPTYDKYKAAVERMPDAGPEQWLKASNLYDDYVITKAREVGEDPLNGIEVTHFGDRWNLYDRDTAKGSFDSKEEAYAAKKTLASEKAIEILGQKTVKRPGFEMTPELRERVRRGLSAYRYGGEVENALDVARSLK